MMYNIKEQVSDQSGKNLKIYRAIHDMSNAQALDDILLNIKVPEIKK